MDKKTELIYQLVKKKAGKNKITDLVVYESGLSDMYEALSICSSSLQLKEKQTPTFEEFVKTFDSKEWYAEHLYLTDNGWVSISLILDKYIKKYKVKL